MVGWGSILTDLGAVHAAANELALLIERGHGNTLQSEGISWMIVVRYGRCYALAAGRRAKLDEDDIAKRLPNDLASLPRGLIERRNGTFAHAGDQCQHGMHVFLLEKDNEPQLIASPAFSAPGPIADPEQARRIADLTAAIRPIVEDRRQRANQAFEQRLQRKEPQLVTQLRERIGEFASPEQTAVALMAKQAAEDINGRRVSSLRPISLMRRDRGLRRRNRSHVARR
jgi:hypothetical protein